MYNLNFRLINFITIRRPLFFDCAREFNYNLLSDAASIERDGGGGGEFHGKICF